MKRNQRPEYIVNIVALVVLVTILVAMLAAKHRCERRGGHYLLGFPLYECVTR